MTIAIDAIDYVQLVCFSRPNGWGQFTQPWHGGMPSEHVLWHYYRKHGRKRFDHALDILFS